MRALIWSCLLAILVSSCSMAKLDKYPGVKQDSIPVELHGNYYLKIKPSSKDPNDSVWINISKTKWVYKEGKKTVSTELSHDHIFSKVGKYYVLSVPDESIKKYWNSWVVLPKKGNLELYPIITIKRPDSDKLSTYLVSKFGGVQNSDSIFYYEMNDAAFVKYFEKEIKGSKTFEVIRIKDKKK
jgi:hypothetical protein